MLRDLDSWIHRRLRSYAWKQWKIGKRRFKELRKLGVGKDLAAQTAGSRKGNWHNSRSPALNFALPGRVLAELGARAASGTTCQESLTSRTAVVRTRMPGGVGGGSPRGLPLSRFLPSILRCFVVVARINPFSVSWRAEITRRPPGYGIGVIVPDFLISPFLYRSGLTNVRLPGVEPDRERIRPANRWLFETFSLERAVASHSEVEKQRNAGYCDFEKQSTQFACDQESTSGPWSLSFVRSPPDRHPPIC